MSNVKHKCLDLGKKVSRVGFREEFLKMAKPISGTSVIFSDVQLRALIADIFALTLLNSADKSEDNSTNFKLVLGHREPLINLSKCFAHHLLNNMSANAQSLFNDLQEENYSIKNLFYNVKLVDFVELVLVDPTFSYRQSEFGRYNILFLEKYLFSKKERGKIHKIAAIEKYNVKDYLKYTGRAIDRNLVNTYTYEKHLIGSTLLNLIHPKELTLDLCLDVGKIVQRNVLSLGERLLILQKICRDVILNQNLKRINKKGLGI